MNIIDRFVFISILFVICITVISVNSLNAEQEKICLKMATLAPDNIGWAKHIKRVIHPAIKKATDGNVKLKWYWGGVMGDDKDYIQKMRIGQIDGAALTGQGVVLACQEMAVLELPFMFKNYDEVDYIRIKMREDFDKIAEKNGYKLFIWADQDFDQIYSVNYKMSEISDFKKANFLTWYGELEQSVLFSLGSSPIPINVPEIAASFRQNIVDTFIAPSIWVIGSQMYTVMKYVNPIKIRYSPAAAFITLKSWNKIPENYQKNLLKIRDNEAIIFCNKCRDDSKRAFNAMVKYGIKVSDMNPKSLSEMQSITKKVWHELTDKAYNKKTLDTLIKYLNDFRTNN